MRFETYGYVWPPRPEKPIPDGMLGFYQKRGHVGQVKKNGTCMVIFTNGTDVIYKTRHNDDHKQWVASAEITDYFRNQSVDGQWCVFVAELLHNKTKEIKNVIYIFDVIVWQGEYLVGQTFQQRQDLLMEQLEYTEGTVDHWVVNENVWLAKLITGDLKKFWTSLVNPEDEGLVVKNPKAKLKLCNKQTSNGNWQVKCRVGHRNYGF